ncbi:MAG: hypothetical protein JWO80_2326, partial [Bryobacterales bacterium]|nr:hypothetical protein [Bryobacterales bacterium]
ESGFGSKQKLFQPGTRSLQTPPFGDSDHNRGFHSTTRYDLRPPFDAGLQEFAKFRLGILHLPVNLLHN